VKLLSAFGFMHCVVVHKSPKRRNI